MIKAVFKVKRAFSPGRFQGTIGIRHDPNDGDLQVFLGDCPHGLQAERARRGSAQHDAGSGWTVVGVEGLVFSMQWPFLSAPHDTDHIRLSTMHGGFIEVDLVEWICGVEPTIVISGVVYGDHL